MTWTPSHLTRTQLEERRLKGGQLLRQGRLSQAQIARRLGVSRATVSEWARQLQRGELADLRQRQASGRPPRLSLEQQQQLLHILNRGARAAGFATERWTLARIRQVIACEFAVRYHPNYIGEMLHRWGWSCQQPMERARDRDDAQVRHWLKTDWPRIKKKPTASAQKPCFLMSSGFRFKNRLAGRGRRVANHRSSAAPHAIGAKSQPPWG